MNAKKIRVRFAPSPTGNLHIGGMRTALFNWLYARHNNGTFLIRVEDTDLERSKKEHVEAQMKALEWCGITSDEPLVFQSQRIEEHKKVLLKLLSEKKVYRCDCSPEDLELRVRDAGNTSDFFGYDGFCRTRDLPENHTKPCVIRFAVPTNVGSITVQDLIRGTVVFERSQFDDFIIVRSDGSPTYNFVVVVDDAFMNITTVIRGEDHLSNTPKQILLYQACGFEPPAFAHIPLIMNANGQRLSKRDGAVDVLHYKKEGYLPGALVNYSVRLGWSHGDQEVFTTAELIDYFSLEAVGKKSAVFDIQKLQWLNGVYIKDLATQACFDWIVSDIQPDLVQKLSDWSEQLILKAIELYQERVRLATELCADLLTLHDGPTMYDSDDIDKWVGVDGKKHLERVVTMLDDLESFSSEVISGSIKSFCKEQALKLPVVAQPLRIALTGGTKSPGVFDLLALLGKQESIKRITSLLQFLETD